jgi:hypothetical protein
MTGRFNYWPENAAAILTIAAARAFPAAEDFAERPRSCQSGQCHGDSVQGKADASSDDCAVDADELQVAPE